jgi:sugar phosphate isomerase/epimerase
MYKSLSPSSIGIFGRQSELLEIALTHRFKGVEIDIQEVLRRAQASSAAQACRYLCSAQVKIGGFELPLRWNGTEADFKADLAQVGLLVDVCTALGADRCFTTIQPTCEQRPFHENFQFHVDRLGQVAAALAPGSVKLALHFVAGPADKSDSGFQFVQQVEPLLLLASSIHQTNVGILFDAWNWWVGGGDLEKLRSLRSEQILSVRLADIPAGTDLANITAQQRLMPGEGGMIDSAALLAALDDLGYEGPVAAAPYPGLFKGQTRESIVKVASSVLDGLLTPVAAEKPVAAAD